MAVSVRRVQRTRPFDDHDSITCDKTYVCSEVLIRRPGKRERLNGSVASERSLILGIGYLAVTSWIEDDD